MNRINVIHTDTAPLAYIRIIMRNRKPWLYVLTFRLNFM